MTGRKRQLMFGAGGIFIMGLLFCFSTAYLLRVLLVVIGLLLACGLLIRQDAVRLTLRTQVLSHAQAGESAELILTVSRKGQFLAAGYVETEIEIQNVMFGTTHRKSILMPLKENGVPLTIPIELKLRGEVCLRCVSARVLDPLRLFSVRCAPFDEVRTVCYPPRCDVELILSHSTAGTLSDDGVLYNRRGGDPTETFDIRDYEPGDDVRAIHWKLTSKLDRLFVREASEPLHLDVLLLPDLGAADGISAAECNSAAALTAGVGEEMCRQGIPFCFAVPGQYGLQRTDIRCGRDLQRALTEWLGRSLAPESGTGLKLFQSEHLEQHFTRLLIISAGAYVHDVSGLTAQIGVTILSTNETADESVYTVLQPDSGSMILPAHTENIRYRIIC